MSRRLPSLLFFLLPTLDSHPAALVAAPAAEPTAVRETAREIPVAKEADVVVVGGSSGAVSAAVAAAEAGAKVFLLTPRTYLGEDLCATLRLWLEPGETPATPLARRMYTPAARRPAESIPAKFPDALPYEYTTSPGSAPQHRDHTPPDLLKDGRWDTPERHSVQYDGDVTITADLGATKPLREAAVVIFHASNANYNAEAVSAACSLDGTSWREHGVKKCEGFQPGANLVRLPLDQPARYVRMTVRRAEGSSRLLLGELVLLGAAAAPTPAPGAAAPAAPASLAVEPLQVKRALDEALIAANVDFLFSSYPTELLVDEAGRVCGVVMTNRTGRQAVRARVIIDATERATVARLAGARFRSYPAGPQEFRRVVVGGALVTGDRLQGRATGHTIRAFGQKTGAPPAPIFEYTLRLPLPDGSFASRAAAEQLARDLTFHPDQLDAAENLYQVPPDAMHGERSAKSGAGAAATVPLEACRPAGVPRLFVLGGAIDIARREAEALLRPLALMTLGTRVGGAAAAEAKGVAPARTVRVADLPGRTRGSAPARIAPGEVREFLTGLRPTQAAAQRIASPDRSLPVLGTYDVVVVGGGTGGAPAGISAGRAGARTLLLEYLHGLGGVGTMGMISRYYHGYRGGFTAEVDQGVAAMKATNEIVGKAEWWRRSNREAGTTLWFGVLGGGTIVQDGLVRGVVVATPDGRGVVLAHTVIDSTGNADVAAAAGARCNYTDGAEASVQGTGLPPWELGAGYTNTDWTFADDTDVVDFWHHFVLARQKFPQAYDVGQLVDTRERRRIVGDVTINPMDVILGRTWPDSVAFAKSNFDSHGFTVHPVFVAMPPDKQSLSVSVPFRALLPQGLDGLLVTGLGVSAHRDAMPVIRMQPDVQNQGYACGRAAAMVAKAGTTIRNVDLKELQRHLVEKECLPASVLTDQDSLPLSDEKIVRAVDSIVRPIDSLARVDQLPTPPASEVDGVVRNREALAVIFTHPDKAVPLLTAAHARAQGDEKLASAHVLAMLGGNAGADTLVARLRAAPGLDQGWNFRGMGQFGRSLSELDSYLVALSRTGDPRAVDVALEQLQRLTPAAPFSHHRACAMALERMGDPRAAAPLAALLRQPGMTGFATANLEAARLQMRPNPNDNVQRNESLRELVLARALFRCGDHEGLGERILRQYASDLRGHYARHAQAVLAAGRAPRH